MPKSNTKSDLILVTLGGTIACQFVESDKGKFLEPTLNHDVLLRICREFHGEFMNEVEVQKTVAPYSIDSQVFDFDIHGKQIEEVLNQHFESNLLITTGTDTIKWLAVLIRNLETQRKLDPAHKNRSIVILSSMISPSDRDGERHVSNIIRAGMEIITSEKVEPGVYVASATDASATEIFFFSVNLPHEKLTKTLPSGYSAIVGGGDKYLATIDPDGKTNIRKAGKVVGKDLSEGAAKEESDLDKFIKGTRMRSLPILCQTRPEAVQKYCANLSEGDIVALEVGANWLNENGEIKESYRDVIEGMTRIGVKVILNNRNLLEGERFQPSLSKEQFNAIKKTFVENGRVQLINSVSTAATYAKLATLPQEQKDSAKIDQARDQEIVPPIGLRYVPSFKLFKSGYADIRECFGGKVVMEALVGGFLPEDLLKEMSASDSPSTFTCGAYPVSEVEKVYAASAGREFLRKFNIEQLTVSASDKMSELNREYNENRDRDSRAPTGKASSYVVKSTMAQSLQYSL